MPGSNLTRNEAHERANAISTQSYQVTLDLTTSSETFATTSTIEFAASPGASTFIDFLGESVESITLNGASVDPSAWDGNRIALTGLQERNTVTIAATGRYMNTGEGLHRFVDPVDNEVYLYSQFEVPDSRRMYPVFEQPDLKATFAFTVTGPSHWQIISNSPTPAPSPVAGRESDASVATWTFAPTPRISSYITALVAGPYEVVRDEVSTRAGVIPLGVFCRKSLREFLDVDNILSLTKDGFAFFDEEFDCGYPFAKYDQIFTPEYNMGAMENAGCVTINEVYIFRAKTAEATIERRALTILHELAHMWFGNLVTMRWWNDLWLNESFAEWASTTAQAEATQWSDAWTTFCISEKSWAYRQDQLSTTHPVVADIRDLHDVEVNFDGITYAKGGSVLKQLVAYVGRDAFRDGLRAYFAKHAWSNTELSDLLTELETTSGRELDQWSKVWLETAGVATLTPIVEVDAQGVYTSVTIEQSAPAEWPTLRPHRLAIGCYTLTGDTLERTHRVEIDIDGASTAVPELVGIAQPDLLLVNDDDLAYAKIRLDERSLATAIAHPRGFTDSLPQALVLASAWDMTRDAQMPAGDALRLLLAALPGEENSTFIRILLAQVATAVRNYIAPERREQVRAETVQRLRELASEAKPGSDLQLQLMQAYAGLLAVGDDTSWAAGLLDGSVALPGLAVDTEMRWHLLTGLAAAQAAGDAEIDAELARDNTATGRERAAKARASIPDAAHKQAAWTMAVGAGDEPNSVLEASGLGFARAADPGTLAGFVGPYHEALEQVWAARTHATAESVVTLFYPATVPTQELLSATNAWLESHPDAPAGLRRLVSENRDNVLRAQAAAAQDSAAPGTRGMQG